MEDLKFVYEHYRVPRSTVRNFPVNDIKAYIDHAAQRYDDDYRRRYLIPASLRDAGAPAYLHGREPATRGGKTVCKVLRWDAEEDCWTLVARGVARCSLKDQFNYEIGRRIAKGRALKQMEEGAIER